jgi:RNA polymerase sigma-70 factor (ECF subfamily)
MERATAVDREVIDRARAGDRDALADLWRTYQPQILRFLRSCGSTSPDDVASQVWIEVGRSLTRFDGDGRDFQRWIFTITRRRDIDDARRSQRRRETSTGDVEDRLVDMSVDSTDGAFPLETAVELVASLPRQMAEAIMLRVVHDLDVGAVAEIMDVSEGNVRVLVHRGLTKLRARIEERRTATSTTRPARHSGPGIRRAAVSTDEFSE